MGILVQALGAPLAILLDALSYLVSAVGLAAVRRREPPRSGGGAAPAWHRDLWAGLALVRRHPALTALVLAMAVGGFFGGFFSALYEIFVFRVAHLTPLLLGVLVTTGGVGALLAAVAAPRLMRRVPFGRLVAASFVLNALADFLIPAAPRHPGGAFLFLLGAQFVGDGSGTVFGIVAVVAQQRVVDEARLGRLAGGVRLVTEVLAMGGALMAGILAVVIGVRQVFWILPVGTLLAAPVLCHPALRRAVDAGDLVPAP
jgi:Na+/melibiose symporter-like transporter